MKSTYKLFGTYWDGIKAIDYDELHISNNSEQSIELVSFQRLLSVRDKTDFNQIIEPFNTNECITIGIDYWTKTSNRVLCIFLKKRLCQMIAHLSEKYPEVRCIKA